MSFSDYSFNGLFFDFRDNKKKIMTIMISFIKNLLNRNYYNYIEARYC